MVEAGVGKAEILLTADFFPLEHFTYNHDHLFSRVIILKDAQTMIFVSLEMTSLQDYAVNFIKKKIYSIYPTTPENIFISVTHTFSAPHTRSLETLQKADRKLKNKNQAYLELLAESVAEAVYQAKQTIQPISLSCHYAQSDCNINRDVAEEDGYWLGKNPAGYSNKKIPVIQLWTKFGKRLAILYSVDVQSSIVEKIDMKAVSSDLIGWTSQKIEKQCHCTALFMLGAGADQTPRVAKNSFTSLENLSTELSNEIVRLLNESTTTIHGEMQLEAMSVRVKGQKIPDMKSIRPTSYYEFVSSEDRRVDIDLFTMGELAIVMMKPEITSIVGKKIRAASTFKVTMIATMINGGQKYMADRASYQRFTYESMNSMFACGSAELVSQEIIKKLQERK